MGPGGSNGQSKQLEKGLPGQEPLMVHLSALNEFMQPSAASRCQVHDHWGIMQEIGGTSMSRRRKMGGKYERMI